MFAAIEGDEIIVDILVACVSLNITIHITRRTSIVCQNTVWPAPLSDENDGHILTRATMNII